MLNTYLENFSVTHPDMKMYVWANYKQQLWLLIIFGKNQGNNWERFFRFISMAAIRFSSAINKQVSLEQSKHHEQ